MTRTTSIEQLFREHYAAMYRLALSLLYDAAEANDVVSDVFERLMHDHTVLLPSTAGGYLLHAVRNRCLNAISHKSIRERVEKQLLTDAQCTSEADDERWTQTVQAIDALQPPLRRQILKMRYEDGLSYEEIAQQLGVSKVTVYNHLSKAIDQLRRQLNNKQ